MKISDKEKLSLLEQESLDKTKDNFTAYLIPIDKVKGTSYIEDTNEVQNVVVASANPIKQKKYILSITGKKCIFHINKQYILYGCIFILLLLGVIGGCLCLFQ